MIPGRCTCGELINRERCPILKRFADAGESGWRYDYPDPPPDNFKRWALRCRSCSKPIDETWMPLDRSPVSLGAVTNVREV